MGSDVRINLLVSQGKTGWWTDKRFWAVVLVLLSYLVMGGMAYSSFQEKQQAERENKALSEDLGRGRDTLPSRSNAAAYQQEIVKKSDEIKRIKENRILVTEACREAARILPPDVDVSEFSVDETGLSAKGEGQDIERIAFILEGFSRSSLFEAVRLMRCEETAGGRILFSVRAEWSARKNGE